MNKLRKFWSETLRPRERLAVIMGIFAAIGVCVGGWEGGVMVGISLASILVIFQENTDK